MRVPKLGANDYLGRMFEFCIPTRSAIVPDGPDWLHGIEYDGYRLRLEPEATGCGVRVSPLMIFLLLPRNRPMMAAFATTMKRFFFDLAGELPARDMQGHECASRREARKHATFIAHRIGTERPGFAKGGNAIEVRDEDGERFFTAPIKSTLRGVE